MSKISDIHDYRNTLNKFLEQSLPFTPAYQNNYIATRCRALHNHFPMLCKLLGETIFTALANTYSQHFPSNCWDINMYGKEFSNFVNAQKKSGLSNDFNWETIAWVASSEYALLNLYYQDSNQERIEVSFPFTSKLEEKTILQYLNDLTQCHPWLSFDINEAPKNIFNDDLSFSVIRYLDEHGFRVIVRIRPAKKIVSNN